MNGPPIQVSWRMQDEKLFMESGIRGEQGGSQKYTALIGIGENDDGSLLPYVPLQEDVWYRMLFRVSLSTQTNTEGCPVYDEQNQGTVTAWMMNNDTGLFDEIVSKEAPIGYVTDLDTGLPRVGADCEFQWKVGVYANNLDQLTIYYDNVAYGKRWNNITKERLTGYHKTVLSLPFDEGSGTVVNDASWVKNGGQQGESHSDYNNDGTVVGGAQWNPNGVGKAGRSLSFTGSNYVSVPMDIVDFDFGNYLTVSAWVRTQHRSQTNRGLVLVDENSNDWKVLMYMSEGLIAFGVRHPDNSYSKANYSFTPGTYADNAWHHIVGTYNRFGGQQGGRLTLYVDGIQALELDTPFLPIARGEYQLAIGKFSNTGFFIGDIDEVNVLNHAWSDTDVAQHYVQMLPVDSDIWGNIKMNGNPVNNRKVLLKQIGETKQTTKTNATGEYEFDTAVSGKTFKVIIKGPNFSAGAGTDVSGCIKLKGNPVINKKVLLKQKLETKKTTLTNSTGCYSFNSVVTGKTFKVIIKGPVVP